ncbi:MAG: Fic family protein [Bacteroidetes bacterium]|jgi:Fic family protein|nr:Fic family protein [Bacteroidota bacterium]MBT3934682.1 Fic family protein [Bacteroidota bacterium]MBT4337654.1 Fic family protein [Bacteroidota bacterium]MBT4728603.1 Fic family protein [Bacteroidota bacterium]MBT4968261.1 Fic family protein [Bacteroidota bacterium]
MENTVHTFRLNIDWELINLISQVDRFDASWTSIEKREGQSLKQLKSIATVRSVGASTRIEGSKLSNEEVEVLLKEIDITKIEDRDSQEVLGYFDTLDLISGLYDDIKINENGLKNLHNILLKYSDKDKWHKGDYKQHSNSVEAKLSDGTKQIIFRTTEAGYPTQDAMRLLIDWYKKDNKTHPLVKCALFAYDFVSIHPFQDGNGRLSRLISTLLLLKNGYKWIQYVSFEHEIESRKNEYYRVLRNCQAQRPNENVTEWVNFFFNALINIQGQLMKKLEFKGVETQLSPREKSILTFIGNNAGCKSGEIAKKLGIPSPTVKRILPELLEKNLITKHGVGPGTNYSLK